MKFGSIYTDKNQTFLLESPRKIFNEWSSFIIQSDLLALQVEKDYASISPFNFKYTNTMDRTFQIIFKYIAYLK